MVPLHSMQQLEAVKYLIDEKRVKYDCKGSSPLDCALNSETKRILLRSGVREC